MKIIVGYGFFGNRNPSFGLRLRSGGKAGVQVTLQANKFGVRVTLSANREIHEKRGNR